jgi:hypothetical protein
VSQVELIGEIVQRQGVDEAEVERVALVVVQPVIGRRALDVRGPSAEVIAQVMQERIIELGGGERVSEGGDLSEELGAGGLG